MEGPPNKKGRPFGSGTTNATRKANRAHLQWDRLAGENPADPQVLVRHLEQLEAAQKKCQARLQEELGKALERQREEDLAAAEAAKKKRSNSVAGGSKKWGKDGTARKVILTPAEPLEKGSNSSKPGLGKPNKMKKETGQNSKDLEKSKEPGTSSSASKDLEKSKEPGNSSSTKGLEKPKTSKGLEKPGLDKPLVMVDWHQTLENDDAISSRDLHALELLSSRCRVCILSYVASDRMAEKVMEDIHTMVPFHEQLFGKEVCWAQIGNRGKCHVAYEMDAMAIFDDNRKICQECMEWGLDVYPIRTQHQSHKWILPEDSFGSFAEAVDKFFSYHPDL